MAVKLKLKKSKEYTEKYLENVVRVFDYEKLESIAEDAINKFRLASPTEEIANNWSYEIKSAKNKVFLFFDNATIQNGVNIAIIMDSGHATRNGSWVNGSNYLSEPTQEAYEKILNETWEALTDYERNR